MSLNLKNSSDAVKQKVMQAFGEPVFASDVLNVMGSYQDFALTSTQMDTLNATPVTLISAVAGCMHVVEGIMLFVDAGSTPFELGSGVLEFRYVDGSGQKVVTDIINGTVESATDVYQYSPGILASGSLAQCVNVPVVAHTSTDVTAGNGTIYGRIYYKTVKVAELA